MLKTSFETQVCSRCHGSGKYLFCQDYGDKCFKCAGHGHVLSKRGAIASQFYAASCQVPMSSLKVGDSIKVDGITLGGRGRYSYSATVVKVERSQSQCHWGSGNETGSYYPLVVFTEHAKFGPHSLSAQDSNLVRVYRADDSERLAKALEYQATLTKAGTIKKTRNNPKVGG